MTCSGCDRSKDAAVKTLEREKRQFPKFDTIIICPVCKNLYKEMPSFKYKNKCYYCGTLF